MVSPFGVFFVGGNTPRGSGSFWRDMQKTYWRNPETGLVEGIDESGRVVSIQKSMDVITDAHTKAGFREIKRADGTTVWVQDGLNVTESKSWFYNPALGGAIASEVAGGSALSTLSKKHEWAPPYAVIARWLVTIPEFKSMIDQAVKDRALVHLEDVLTTAADTYDRMKNSEDEIAAAKLKVEALKFMSEKGDPDRYGKGKGSVEANVQIVIDTGIRREELKDVTPITKEIDNG